jgi:hypothetical protein
MKFWKQQRRAESAGRGHLLQVKCRALPLAKLKSPERPLTAATLARHSFSRQSWRRELAPGQCVAFALVARVSKLATNPGQIVALGGRWRFFRS